jgi:tripartite motif-containing protein 37
MYKWLSERKSACPHCRCSLRPEQLVNCRFMEEVYNAVERLELNEPKIKITNSEEMCTVHDALLHYYCQTCEISICRKQYNNIV